MPDRRTPTILFVDDQPEVTAALEEAFHKKPFCILTASSGAQALEMLAQAPVDVVVSDEQMPRMSGSQLLTAVRRDYPAAVRIILSGHANFKATLAAINEAQAHRFLMKPCSPDEIAVCIATALDERDRQVDSLAEMRRMTEVSRLQAKTEFDAALERLWIAFQPVVQHDAKIFGYEALVRSDHPELGSPYALFRAAELFGRVQELERHIRDRIAVHAAALPAGVQVMVNVSPAALSDETLYSTGCSLYAMRDRVIFEITERDKLHEISAAEAYLERLRDLGYRIAVDDLGAGYAGLNSFALIRPDVVKFDRELIREIQNSSTKRDLVRLIAAFCRDMGVLTVAEGIETSEEFDAVRSLGCDLLQGFYIARPAGGFAVPSNFDTRPQAAAVSR